MSATELEAVQAKATEAEQTVEADSGASPVLAAVVRDFSAKATKAVKLAAEDRQWEAVIELEQAGDSSKAAAEADTGASEATKATVLDAHPAICMLKANLAKA